MGALGMDYMRFLNTRDHLERNLMIQLHKRISKEHDRMQSNLAVMIANNLGKVLK